MLIDFVVKEAFPEASDMSGRRSMPSTEMFLKSILPLYSKSKRGFFRFGFKLLTFKASLNKLPHAKR